MLKKSLSAVVLALLVVTTPAFAAGDNPNQAMQRRWRKDIIKSLDLTAEQKEQIEKQHSINAQSWGKLRDELRTKRRELKQELEKPDIDRNRINAIVAGVKVLMGEQLELRVNNILAIKQILTPEQFKKLQESKAKNNAAVPRPLE